MTSLGFILFSLIEGVGIYVMMMSVFRLKPWGFLIRFLPLLLIMVLQSYILREEIYYPYLVPVINILLFVFFFTIVIKVPLVWSFIITIFGYFIFGIIQYIMLLFMFSTVEEMNSNYLNGYLLQLLTAFIQIIFSILLLKFRFGFIAEFDRFGVKHERNIVIAMIIFSLIGITLVSFSTNAMILVAFSFLFFLYFAIKKEREDG